MTEVKSSSPRKAKTLLGLQWLSDFGDQISCALVALTVLDITKSTEKVGLVYFATTGGYFIFTLFGGFLGDRVSRRKTLFFADVARGLVVLLLILALQERSMMLIYGASFILSILGAVHNPVKMSVWAESIPSRSLERYNSLSEFSIHASTIIGPLIASYFIVAEMTTIGFILDAATFFVCAVIFSRVVTQTPKQAQTSASSQRDLLHGFRLIANHMQMSKFISYDAIQMMGFGAFNATFLVLAQRDFGFSKVEFSWHLSVVAALTAIGALLGASSVAEKINPISKLVLGALISAGAFLLALHIGLFPVSSLFVGLCDGIAVLTIAVTRTKVQLFAKSNYPEFLSSILASRAMIIKGATLCGVGLALLVDDVLGLKTTLMLFVIPIAASCVPLLLSRRQIGASLLGK